MNNAVCLDSFYSTTRLVTALKPSIKNKLSGSYKSTLFLDNNETRGYEGGLRKQGYFKNSYKLKPLISIITIVYNGEKYLEETILSVISQSYDNIEYIIIDANSTDGTIDILKKYDSQIDYWVSESDSGMYEALTKGFSCISGDFMGYINSDDYFLPNAIKTIAELHIAKPNLQWITGINSWYNSNGSIIRTQLQLPYRNEFIDKGIYGTKLPYIQQENTFWNTNLLQYIDLKTFSSFKLAGDYYMWLSFSKYVQLNTVSSAFAGFRKHENNKSLEQEKYLNEIKPYVGNCKLTLRQRVIFLYDKFVSLLCSENVIKKLFKNIVEL
ncbi:MAG: glycosyltransferase [Helicobacteraceae bacterium]|nr:glycosyltransferase [Helicobacteraceae bacterium]